MSSNLPYRRDVDGLRAIAVLAVVCYHADPHVAPGGFVGVDVFFVISGYLISGVILDDVHAGTFAVHRFYARRIKRIFPALALLLIACLGFGWFTLLPNEYGRLGAHVSAGGGFVLNFVLWRESGYFDSAAELKPLLHLWSLGIEEQFYLVWPLALALVHRVRRSPLWLVVPAAVLSFLWNVKTIRSDAVADFYSPATRLWELAIGGAIACTASRHARAVVRSAARRNALAVVGLLLVLASIFVLRSDRDFPGWWAALPVSGAAFIIAAGPDAWSNRTLLSYRGVVFIGLISYPLYLWHWPVLAFLRILGSGTPSLALRGIAIATSGVAAWLTYRWIERPIRLDKSAHKPAVALALIMAGVIAMGLAVHALDGLPFRMPTQLRVVTSPSYDFGTDARVGHCWLAADRAGDAFADDCFDPGTSRPLVLIWGDSHAARLYPGVKAIARPDGGVRFRLAQYTRDSCAPILDHGYANCAASNAFVIGKIRDTRPDVVILFAAWSQHSTSWRRDDPLVEALERTVRAIRDLGVSRILIVGPAPQWQGTLPRVLLNASWRVPRSEFPQHTRYGLDPLIAPIDEAMASSLSTMHDAIYVSVWRTLCHGDAGCLTYVDDTPDGLISWDAGHLTTAGATYLARRLPIVEALGP